MNKLILSLCIAEIFSISSIMYFPALLPDFQAEWGITNTETGWINGIFYGGYAAHCWELFGYRSWLVAFLFFSLSLQPEVSYKFGLQNIATLIILAGVPASILGNEGALRWGRRRVINTIMLISGLLGIVIGFSAGLPFMIVVVLCFVYCIFVMLDSGSLAAGMVSAARAHERSRTMAVFSFLGFCMAFLAPLAVGGVLDIVDNGIVGWGFAFASLGLVEITGPVWLRLFPSGVET